MEKEKIVPLFNQANEKVDVLEPVAQPPEAISSFSSFKDSFIDWVILHAKTILLSVIGLLMALFLLYQFTGKKERGSSSDFIGANTLFQQWVSSTSEEKETFQKLENVLHRHPELLAKFGGLIAERCLQLQDLDGALRYAKGMSQNQKKSSYFSQFSKTSLLIGEGKYDEALSLAKKLKTAMEEDRAFWQNQTQSVRTGSLLFAFNLLRIASLERQQGSSDGERKAWEEFEKHASYASIPMDVKMDHPEAYALLYQNYREQAVSLSDYISHRKAHLLSSQ